MSSSVFLMRIKLSSRKTIGGECTPQCPKERNDTDCGVFTCLFAKRLLFSSGNHCSLNLNEDPRNEMASDLLNLASSLRSENDSPEVFQ